jgi:hypothetical protein
MAEALGEVCITKETTLKGIRVWEHPTYHHTC